MSALRPIATELVRRNELPLCANCGREHLQQKPGRGPFRLLTKLM